MPAEKGRPGRNMKTNERPVGDVETIPGVGPSIGRDLRDLGLKRVEDLIGKDPEKMYQELCELRNAPIDRCVLYVFRCATYVAGNRTHDPELLKWWNWKDSEKVNAPPSRKPE